MITAIVMTALSAVIAGYLLRVGQERLSKPPVKDETDRLLDEIRDCGEVIDVKLSGKWERQRQLEFRSGVVIREGERNSYNNEWSEYPMVYVKNISIELTGRQMRRVHQLVDEKHAEAGRQQITERLLTE